MRAFLFAGTLGLFLALPSWAEEDGNLLENASFEAGAWPSLKSSEIDTSGKNAHTGQSAMLLFNQAGKDDWSTFQARVKDIEPGRTYRFALYAKGSAGIPCKMKIHWTVPGESDVVSKLERKFEGEDFELFEIITDAPVSATDARLFVENWTTGADVWIDDLYFGPVN